MSWTRVGVIYAVLVVLAGYVALFERSEPVPESDGVEAAAPIRSLLEVDATDVASVVFSRSGKSVRAERADDGRWRAVAPAGATVPADLIEATVATLTAGQASELLAPEPENALAAYGLDTPKSAVEVVLRNAPDRPIIVSVGGSNPTRTAVYARRSDRPSIFLVGLNLSYYVDLILEAGAG